MKKPQFGKLSQPVLISILLGLTALISAAIWLSQKDNSKQAHGHDDHENEHAETEQHDEHAHQEDEHSSEGEIQLSAQQMVEHGLKTSVLGFGSVENFVALPGKLVVNTDQQAHISPNFSGHVEQVNVALGQSVTKGQTLAILSVPELIDQQANLGMAQSSLNLAHQEYLREQKLWAQGISAKQDLQRAENAYRQAQISVQAAQKRLQVLGAAGQNGRFVIRAPISGIISQKDIVIGENVQLADQIFVIENLKDLWLEFNIPTQTAMQLESGQAIRFKINGSEQYYDAVIQTLTPQADAQTGRLQVRAKLQHQAKELRPNVLVNVLIHDAKAKTALRIQKSALQQIDGRPAIFVIESEEKGQIHLKAQSIEVGAMSNDGQWLEVISGLKEGQKYISQGSFLLKSELEKDEAGHEH